MLVGTVYHQLAEVNRRALAVLVLLDEKPDPQLVDQAVSAAHDALAELQLVLGAWALTGADNLHRHLHFIAFYYRKNQHSRYAEDLSDIPGKDLPAVADSVVDWERSLYDSALMDALRRSWQDGNYLGVVRDAFVHLEQRLRRAGSVDPGTGLAGEKLVTRLLARSSPHCLELPPGLLAASTSGEAEGVLYFFKGAFLLFRNAAAHRSIPYTAEEAQLVVAVVELCLRLLDGNAETTCNT